MSESSTVNRLGTIVRPWPRTAARSSMARRMARGDLDRLDLGLEGAREGAVDGTLEALLDPVEQTHCPHLLTCCRCLLLVSGPRS